MTKGLNKLEQKRALSHAAFIEAGIDTLQSPVTNLDNLRGQELAVSASRTTGSFFNIWETQQAYKEELASRILSPDEDLDYDKIAATTKEAGQTGLDARRVWSSTTIGGLIAQRTFLPRIAVYNTPHIDEGTADLLTEYYARQQDKVTTAVAETFDIQLHESESSSLVFAVEDLAVRSVRRMIDVNSAADAASRLIPQ